MKWADYVAQKGLDPENQLSTDDFAGHLSSQPPIFLLKLLKV